MFEKNKLNPVRDCKNKKKTQRESQKKTLGFLQDRQISNGVKIILVGIIFLATPLFVSDASLVQKVNFFVDPAYDLHGRKEILASLVKNTTRLFFYVDKDWWDELDFSKKQSLNEEFYNLSTEFEYDIYPKLTSTFGSEPSPGIDRDERITILIHQMLPEVGGYFNSGDVYSRFQVPRSNEREMVYLNARHIETEKMKSILAHEFTHLITFNQKDIIRRVTEEVWLNDVRAEYAITLLGYDDVFRGSNLENRVRAFLSNPSDSLTEWLGRKPDYGAVNLFGQYLVDHYGVKILVDSLQSSKVGIPSINEALAKNGFKEDFSQIFNDWLITLLVNDCSLGPKYCYKNENLKNLKIAPRINFLPLGVESILSVHNTTKEWAGNWQKIVGGKGNLTFEFDGQDGLNFKASYLICDYQEKCQINFLVLDKEQEGKIAISEFNIKYNSLTVIPFVHTKIFGFNGLEPFYSFSWKASITEKIKDKEDEELRRNLLAEIELLKKEIARLQAEIRAISIKRPGCQSFDENLYFGLRNDARVRCLQEFLKAQGSDIYPEGLVTGNFLTLTKTAVIRFQEKFAQEILAPWKREKGTGYVGRTTRDKINKILESNS